MRDDTPAVYLLAGPAGPAKAAYVRALIDHGVAEVVAGSPAQTAASLVDHVRAGRDSFLDHDTGAVEERDRYKALVEEHGGEWCLINFTVDHAPLTDLLGRRVVTATPTDE